MEHVARALARLNAILSSDRLTGIDGCRESENLVRMGRPMGGLKPAGPRLARTRWAPIRPTSYELRAVTAIIKPTPEFVEAAE
jgi:hypothetical protein